MGYFDSIVLGGMYPFDPIGHFWYGATYFQSGLELPNFHFLAPPHIIREFRQALHQAKTERTVQTFKKVVLIH